MSSSPCASRSWPLPGWIGAIALTACGSPARESTRPAVRSELEAPALDPTPRCADVRSVRVCWDQRGRATSAVRATFPGAEVSPLGFRCVGAGAERRCSDRSRDASGFGVRGTARVQRVPRLPDDGEWECSESAGAMVCRGGERPSGVAPGGKAEGFFCGPRRAQGKSPGERICVDLSPDFPPGATADTRCRFEGTARVCETANDVHSLGDACDAGHPCVDGARCVAGWCAPRAPDPSCWNPSDCDQGTCRFGSCFTEEP